MSGNIAVRPAPEFSLVSRHPLTIALMQSICPNPDVPLVKHGQQHTCAIRLGQVSAQFFPDFPLLPDFRLFVAAPT